ncbi:MAG: hypothetical protein P1V19_20105 [Gimesia sp.]|nr:hypothetical protein [Gimesia sp.]
MDELSILIVGDFDWQQFIAAVADAVGSAGEDTSDDDDRRHQWMVEDFEVTGIANPEYEDDCGIPFTTFSHQVMFVDANATLEESRIRQYVNLVKSLDSVLTPLFRMTLLL